jgi:hypothetical protein
MAGKDEPPIPGASKRMTSLLVSSSSTQELRTGFKLPAQMACSVPRQVGATYKGLWTKVKKNNQDRKACITKKRYKGLDQPPEVRFADLGVPPGP